MDTQILSDLYQSIYNKNQQVNERIGEFLGLTKQQREQARINAAKTLRNNNKEGIVSKINDKNKGKSLGHPGSYGSSDKGMFKDTESSYCINTILSEPI